MSVPYSVTNTVDVFSPTAPGQLNLFNNAGTFSVQLRAPATVTPYSISLPPTVGSTGQFCQITSAGALTWAPTPTPTNVDFPAQRRYYNSSTTRTSTTSAVNVTVDYLYFAGTSVSRNTPSLITSLLGASVTGTTTCTVTITDITNATTIISSAQPAFAAATEPTIRNLGVPTNLSSGPAVWQVFIRRTAGAGTIYFYGLQVVGDEFLY